MIDAILGIIDRLIKLAETREEQSKAVRAEVESVYADLLLVHRDYVRMFEETLGMLPKVSTSGVVPKLEGAIAHLKQRRTEFEPVRTKLHAMAKVLDQQESTPLSGFANEIREYFAGEIIIKTFGPISQGSAALSLLSWLERTRSTFLSAAPEAQRQSDLQQLSDEFKRRLDFVRLQFAIISESYATIRFEH
jgi:hypothetical protein